VAGIDLPEVRFFNVPLDASLAPRHNNGFSAQLFWRSSSSSGTLQSADKHCRCCPTPPHGSVPGL